MAQLAIKGHATRGSEVIALLEMLGGKNIHNYDGTFNECYIIDNNKICTIYTSVAKIDDYVIITLEDFLEKYPYKVGDKVIINGCDVRKIHSMYWDRGLNRISYILENHIGLSKGWDVNELQPTEETIKDMAEKDKVKAPDMKGEDYVGKRFGYKIPDGYEFDTVYNGKIILKPKKPTYPKTYGECCECLSLGKDGKLYTKGYKASLIQNFQKLLICRYAYWKIAGDWKEKRKDKDEAVHYVIYSTLLDGVIKEATPNCFANYLLDFPTAEMRDAFYDNFKDLIEECKELL